MQFRDEAEIEVLAGKGGDGLVSFRREKFVPRGGPDGGDGGDGGDVVMVATGERNSLLEVGRKPRYAARDGRPGGPRDRTGGRGADCLVEVPVGTLVRDAARGNLLCDLVREGQRVVVARGGRGGKGNARFATAVHQAPRHATPGRAGEQRRLSLALKLVAEVGLVGLPNAGKSTFLARVSAARPKVADYPFTTLHPTVGIAAVGELDSLVVADLPGLIEGAAEGQGLGHRFLRHAERCPVLLHLVDVSPGADADPVEAWRTLEAELARYSADLAAKPRLVVATKHFEDPASEPRLEALREAVERAGRPLLAVSSVLGRGLGPVLEWAWRHVRAAATR